MKTKRNLPKANDTPRLASHIRVLHRRALNFRTFSDANEKGPPNRSKVPIMVGMARFELTTFRTPSERATRLRYIPFERSSRLRNGVRFVKLNIF